MHMFSPFSAFAVVSAQQLEPRSVIELYESFVTRLSHVEYAELGALLAFLRGVATIHQTHHWQSQGDSFYGDHLLFERIYNSMVEEIDSIAERSVGLGCSEIVNPTMQASMTSSVIEWIYGIYSAPISSLPREDSLIRISLAAEQCLSAVLDSVAANLREMGALSRGLDNLLSGISDKHEESQYLLKRSISV
jgi:DNA-binding ferritin-like protein